MRWDTLILFFYVILMSMLEHSAYDRLDKRIAALEKKPPSSISLKETPKVRVLQLRYPNQPAGTQ